MNILDKVIGVKEASKITGLAEGTIKNYCASGDIKAKKIGKTWVIDKIKLEESMKMKTLNYTGMEYNERQVDVELHVKDFEKVLDMYENLKYYDHVTENITDELTHDLGNSLEEAIENEQDTLVLGYNNEYISFNFDIKKEYGSFIEVEVEYKQKWSEGN